MGKYEQEQTLAGITKALKYGAGDTVQERTDDVLASRGWDKELEKIDDSNFRGLIRHALERLALRHNNDERGAREIEQDRRKKEEEKLSWGARQGDLYSDQYVGLEPDELASKLPHETYYVPSLGREVARQDLAYELAAVAELRKIASAELFKIETLALAYRHELAIFDELLRRGSDQKTSASIDHHVR